MRFIEVGFCPYRFGIAEQGKVMVKCKFSGKIFNLRKIKAVCVDSCPLNGGDRLDE